MPWAKRRETALSPSALLRSEALYCDNLSIIRLWVKTRTSHSWA
jgi:hypothetical protein